MSQKEQVVEGLKQRVKKVLKSAYMDAFVIGSFARGQEKRGSDVDMIVIVNKLKHEDILNLRAFQKEQVAQMKHPLSLEVYEKETLIETFLATPSTSLKLINISDTKITPDLKNKARKLGRKKKEVATLIKKNALDIRRQLIFNLINQNPTGRLFKSSDLNRGQSSQELIDEKIREFASLVKHQIASLEKTSPKGKALSEKIKRELESAIKKDILSVERGLIKCLNLIIENDF